MIEFLPIFFLFLLQLSEHSEMFLWNLRIVLDVFSASLEKYNEIVLRDRLQRTTRLQNSRWFQILSDFSEVSQALSLSCRDFICEIELIDNFLLNSCLWSLQSVLIFWRFLLMRQIQSNKYLSTPMPSKTIIDIVGDNLDYFFPPKNKFLMSQRSEFYSFFMEICQQKKEKRIKMLNIFCWSLWRFERLKKKGCKRIFPELIQYKLHIFSISRAKDFKLLITTEIEFSFKRKRENFPWNRNNFTRR